MARPAKAKKAKKAKAAPKKKAASPNQSWLQPMMAVKAETDVPSDEIQSLDPDAAQKVTDAHEALHRGLFTLMVARSNKFNKPPFCYREFDDGTVQVLRLMGDGSYGDPETYYQRPVPGPSCG